MKITCSSCGEQYRVSDEKIAGRRLKVRCNKCHNKLHISGLFIRKEEGEQQKLKEVEVARQKHWEIVASAQLLGTGAEISAANAVISDVDNIESAESALQCEYIGLSGRRCTGRASEHSSLCFWHNPDAEKKGEEIKLQLEEKAKNKESMEGYELSYTNLEDAYLMEADLSYANLGRANLKDGHLFHINLKGARLFKTNIENANLKESDLEGTDLLGANLNNASLDRANWGDKVLVNEREARKLHAKGDRKGAREKYLEAEEIYRSIRQNYEAAGRTDVAGDFFYREMVMKRKQMSRLSFARIWSKMVDLLCCYGEVPPRIIGTSLTYIVLNAFACCTFGLNYLDSTYTFQVNASLTENLTTFGYGLYFSVVTFTTLGYGDFTPISWSRFVAVQEAFIGVFLIALFILSFVRKMSR